jgi:type 1 fimbriae regulatory protein FimB
MKEIFPMTQTNAAVIPFETPEPKSPYRRRKYHGSDKPSFSVEQLKLFLDTAKKSGNREFAMFLTAFVHGLRASEICNLRVADVDFTANKIDIRRSKNGNPSHQAMQRVNGYSESHALELYLKERATRPGADSPFLFVSQKPKADGSRQLGTAQVYRLFVGICEAAGISEQYHHPHVMRHTAGFLLRDAGIGIEDIAQILGHKSISSTMIYTRNTMDQVGGQVSKAFKKMF